MKVRLYDCAGHLVASGIVPDFKIRPEVILHAGSVFVNRDGFLYWEEPIKYVLASSASLVTLDPSQPEMEPMKEILYKL